MRTHVIDINMDMYDDNPSLKNACIDYMDIDFLYLKSTPLPKPDKMRCEITVNEKNVIIDDIDMRLIFHYNDDSMLQDIIKSYGYFYTLKRGVYCSFDATICNKTYNIIMDDIQICSIESIDNEYDIIFKPYHCLHCQF